MATSRGPRGASAHRRRTAVRIRTLRAAAALVALLSVAHLAEAVQPRVHHTRHPAARGGADASSQPTGPGPTDTASEVPASPRVRRNSTDGGAARGAVTSAPTGANTTETRSYGSYVPATPASAKAASRSYSPPAVRDAVKPLESNSSNAHGSWPDTSVGAGSMRSAHSGKPGVVRLPDEEDEGTGVDAVIVGASPEAGASTGSEADGGDADVGVSADAPDHSSGAVDVIAADAVTGADKDSTSLPTSDELNASSPPARDHAGVETGGTAPSKERGQPTTAKPGSATTLGDVSMPDDGAGTGASADEAEALPPAGSGSGSGSGAAGGSGSGTGTSGGSGTGVVDAVQLEEDANASKEALSKIQQELAEAVSEVSQVLNGTQELAEFAADDDDDVVVDDQSDDGSADASDVSGGRSSVDASADTPSATSAAPSSSAAPASSPRDAATTTDTSTKDAKPTPARGTPANTDAAIGTAADQVDGGSRAGSTTGPVVPHAATIPHLGARNESCRTTCHKRHLRCHAHGFREINTCEALEAAAGCEGGCLGGFGLDKPAAVNIRGHPLTLCFTLSNPTRAGEEERKLGQHKVLFDCDAKMPLSERLCPCSEVDKVKAERERLRTILAKEQELKLKELHRLAELSDNVAMAMERMDRTHTALKATTEALSEREGQLADLVEQDRLSEEVKALSGPGTKIDYDSGVVRLKTGETLTQEEAQQKVLELSKRRNTDPHALLASKFRDPAILVIDNVLLLDVGILLLAAAFGGMAAALAGLPASLGYLVGGAVVGPSGLRLVTKWEAVGTISQFGAVFPLFSLGMQFHFTDHRRYYRASVGGTLAAAGLYTMIIVAVGLATGLMTTLTEALLVAVPTSLSSPGVTVANLLDAGVLGARSGKLSLGVLAVEDLLMCVLMSVPHTAAVGIHWADSLQAVASLALLTGVAVLVARTLRRPVMLDMFYHERNQDVFVLGLVSLCLCMSLVTGRLGLSLEMGAFVAGLTVTWMPDIKRSLASVAPLSRVFGGMFFASVGMLVSPAYVWYHAGALVRTLTVVVLVKVVTMIIIMRMFRFDPVSSLTSAVALAQITEYSLMFTGKAHALGLLSRKTYLQWLSTTVISLVVSPLLMRGLNMWIATMPAGVRDAGRTDGDRRDKTGDGRDAPSRRDVEYDAASGSGAAAGLYHRVTRGASGVGLGADASATTQPSPRPGHAATGGPHSGSGGSPSSSNQDHEV